MTENTLPIFVWQPGTERPDLVTDEDWQRVEAELVANPEAGKLIRDTGGARKLRLRVGGRGKSGGARTIYIYFAHRGRIHFLATYAKNEQEDVRPAARRVLRQTIERLRREGD